MPVRGATLSEKVSPRQTVELHLDQVGAGDLDRCADHPELGSAVKRAVDNRREIHRGRRGTEPIQGIAWIPE